MAHFVHFAILYVLLCIKLEIDFFPSYFCEAEINRLQLPAIPEYKISLKLVDLD